MAKRLSVIIDADTSGFNKSVNDMQKQMAGATDNISKSTKGTSGGFKGMLGSIGKIAGKVGVWKAVDAGINMITKSVGSAVNRFDTLQNSQKVFENMGFDANTASTMMDNLMASIKGLPTSAEDAVQGVQRISSATGELEGAEDIFSAINNGVLAFGGSAENVNSVVEMLSRGLQNGTIDGQQFNSLMANMGPVINAVAEEMGYTTDELRRGLSDGSISVEDFTNELIKMDEEGGAGMESLQQQARDMTGGIGTSLINVQNAINRGMASIIESTNDALVSNGLPDIAEMIQMFSSVMESLMNKVAGVMPVIIGFFAGLFSAILDSTAFQWLMDTASNAMEVLSTAVQTAMALIKGDTGDMFKAVLAGSGDLGTNIGIVIADIVGHIKKVGEVFGQIIQGIVDVFEALMKPLMDWWKENQEEVGQVVMEVWNAIMETFDTVLGIISEIVTEVFGRVVEFITDNQEEIKAIIDGVWNIIKEIIQFTMDYILPLIVKTWEGIKEVISMALDIILGVVGVVMSLLAGDWEEAWSRVKELLKTVWEIMKTLVSNAIKGVWNVIKTVLGNIAEHWSGIWDSIKEVADNIWKAIKNAIKSGIESAKNVITTVLNAIKSVWDTIWNAIKTVITTVWNGIKLVVTTAINVVKTIITTVFNGVKNTVTTIWNGIKTVIDGVWDGIKSGVSTAINGVKTTVTTVFNSVKGTVTRIWNSIKSAIERPIESAKNTVGRMIETIKGFMNFSWSIPKPRLPKVSITKKTGVLGVPYPSFSVGWYASGGIATGPSIVGIGEAGDEAILPLSNKSKMKPFASAVASLMPNGGSGGDSGGGDTVITGNTFVVREEADIKKIAQELKRLDDRESRSRGRRGLGLT